MLIEKLFWIDLTILCSFYLSYFTFGIMYSKNFRYAQNKEYLPMVSLVIPTYDEEDIIDQKISDVVNLEYPVKKMEIIFVDSSSDNTRLKIKQFKENSDYKVTLIEENERKGLANALNLAYSEALGEIVIKTDCDMFLEINSIKKIVKYFQNPEIGAVNGKLSTLNKSRIEEGYIGLIEQIKIAESNLDSSYIFSPFSAYRKYLIEPIDARSVADDGELALKIRKKGFKTIFAPDAIFYEASPTKIAERIKQKSRRAQGHIRLIFQNLDVIFNPEYGKFGTVVFPSNFFMMIISPWSFLFLFSTGSFLLYKILGLTGIVLNGLVLTLFVLMYITSISKSFIGFVETQICLAIGALHLISNGPDFMWKKNDGIREEYTKYKRKNNID